MEGKFAQSSKLLIRLKSAFDRKQKLTFLVGSGLTNSNLSENELGVSSVNEIIAEIRKIFESNNQLDLFNRDVDTSNPSNQYQSAMRLLLDCFGQDDLNKVIVHAVLCARINRSTTQINSTETNLKELEGDINNWFLRKGVDALGEIFVDFKNLFSGPILTSNFDPLIEISIKKHQGIPQSIFLINDGKFSNSSASDVSQVLHFHGYWSGEDTLHTADQLTRPRPQLKGDLRKLLNNTTLVVLAYGGWDDIFTNTLLELIKEGGNNFNVLWSFYEDDEAIISSKYKSLLERLNPAVGQRVILYKGVDCHKLLPTLLQTFNENKAIPEDLESVKEVPIKIDIGATAATIEFKSSISLFDCDVPPSNPIWVGRDKEIGEIVNGDFKTCFITGIGGQGKSGLVSHIVRNVLKKEHGYEYWDWRDFKEEDNRIQTIVTLMIERLTEGRIRAINLTNEATDKVIELFFEQLQGRKIFFVFDNVDQYIDYESLEPLRGLGKIFDLANTLNHNSKFIFTCRPNIHADYSSFNQIKLGPLSIADTENLFTISKVNLSQSQISEIVKEAHVITEGHALWLHLIIAQCKSGYQAVNSFLNDIKAHKSLSTDEKFYNKVENTLDVLWKSLHSNQQLLMRGLAESVTALSDQEIIRFLGAELSANQCGKSLRKLVSLNLLVIKVTEANSELYELHPLVREFIINKFHKNERARFITMLVQFYDAMILVIKPKLNANSPLTYFQKWTHKIELQINNSDYRGSLISIQEIVESILAAGYVEEYFRVAVRLFIEIDWLKAITEDYLYFHEGASEFVRCLADYGRFDDSDAYLEKYAKNISGKGKHYIEYCRCKAYLFWSKDDYSTSIDWSEKAMLLLDNSDLNSNKDAFILHTYALALRDTKKSENIDKAINIFLKGETLEDILTPEIINTSFGGNYYGNIGRCLWFMNKQKETLVCYKKSIRLLLEEQNSLRMLNLGWGHFWMGELLEKNKDFDSAFYFYSRAFFYWKNVALLKARKTAVRIDIMIDSGLISNELKSSSEVKIENFCLSYINAPISR